MPCGSSSCEKALYFSDVVGLCFRDGMLNADEFGGLCRALFWTGAGLPYPLDAQKVAHMFSIFDTDEVREM